MQRLWFEGDTRKSKKNIVHGLRYLHYGKLLSWSWSSPSSHPSPKSSALQLADNGRITDYTAGNVYWRDVPNPPPRLEARIALGSR
jgi:hypothetical protein